MAKAPVNDDEKKALFGGVTDEMRADMTDEELAGIDGEDEEGDDEGEEAEADADNSDADKDEPEGDKSEDDAEDDEDGKDDAGDEDDDKGEGEGADTAVADPGDDAGDEEAEDDEEDDLDVTRSVMPAEWQVPKDADDKVKALSEQIVELADKFDAGDLSAREYHEQRSKLDTESLDLRMQINHAKTAWGKAMADWSERTVRAFLREHKEYDEAKSPTLNRMLDAEVRALQVNTPDPFNPRILRKAHANIQAAMGKTPAADTPKPGKTAAKAKDKTPLVPGKKPQVPPTLARVPQDEIEDAEGGKFARLQRLETRDAHAFEEAMMKMSAKDRASYDEYLAGA